MKLYVYMNIIPDSSLRVQHNEYIMSFYSTLTKLKKLCSYRATFVKLSSQDEGTLSTQLHYIPGVAQQRQYNPGQAGQSGIYVSQLPTRSSEYSKGPAAHVHQISHRGKITPSETNAYPTQGKQSRSSRPQTP